jgi:hypothetical protein
VPARVDAAATSETIKMQIRNFMRSPRVRAHRSICCVAQFS